MLGEAYRDSTDDLYKQEIDRVLARCDNDDWTDRRDYLWQLGSIGRQILGLGISDEEHIEVRRPLLSGLVLETYTRVPRSLRINKNLYIESVKEFYPKLFAHGRNHASNIADYFYYMAPFLRERTLNHLNAGRDLDGILDVDHCRERIRAFQPELSTLRPLSLKQKIYLKIQDRYSYLYHRSRFYREDPVSTVHTATSRLTFRIYLLLEYFYDQRHRRELA